MEMGHSPEGRGQADGAETGPGLPPPVLEPLPVPRLHLPGGDRPESQTVANGLGQVQIRWHHAAFPVAMTTDSVASPALPRREDPRAQQLCSRWNQVVGRALATWEGFLEEAGGEGLPGRGAGGTTTWPP